MVSSLSHFSHAVGLKDKDGLCSEGLIDQNNCASICLLKAEQATASQGLYFQRLLLSAFNVIDLACPVMLQDKHSGPERKHIAKAALNLRCPKKKRKKKRSARIDAIEQKIKKYSNECYQRADG